MHELRRIHRPLMLLAGLAVLYPTAYPQKPADNPLSRFVGCYHMILGPWSPAPKHPEDYVSVTPPEYVWLELTPRSKGDGGHPSFRSGSCVVRQIHDDEASLQRKQFKVGSWSLEGENGILLEWSTGFEWVKVHLSSSGDKLVGPVITGSDDEGSLMPRCSVEAIKFLCVRPY